MVALTISMILLAAVAGIFYTSRQSYVVNQGLARTQEAGRFAIEFLAQDIRMAGYSGCASKLSSGTVDGSGNCAAGTACSIANPGNMLVTFNPDGLSAYTYTGTGGTALADWSPALPSDYFAAGNVKPYTDVIVIQHGSTVDTHLTGNTVPSNANIQLLNTAAIAGLLQANDILMVSDCKSADILRATNVSSGSGVVTIAHSNAANIQNILTHSYGNDATLMKLVSRAYYIGTGASGEPALFRADLAQDASGNPTTTKQEMVEGVEIMKFSFGEDTDATKDYVPNRILNSAASVTSWGKVVTIRAGLATRTGNDVAKDVSIATPLSFDGITFPTPTDKRRRQYYLATIQKRN
jgi:type IV pilus assembly protein PilW